MFPKKFKQSGLLYKKSAQLEAQFEREWALPDNLVGSSSQSAIVQPVEDVVMNDLPQELEAEYIEEEYLEEIDEDDRISDEASILNDGTDDEECYEEEFLEEEVLDIDPEISKLRDSLRTWLIRNKISRNASNSLLSILRNVSSLSAFSSLPQDVRTLLKAPVNVSEQIIAVPGGGQMWYQGVECCLQHYFRDVIVAENAFELNLAVDGIPMYNRSNIQMWPLLMQLHNVPNTPVMVVGIFCGTSKPSDVETFLRPLVTELNRLQDNKININGKEISISVRVIVADSPARAFIKQVCYYNGVHGCLKCKCCGTSLKQPKKVIFEDTTAEERTDADFRNEPCSAKGHRRAETPLTDLKYFDIVKDVATSDTLHLFHSGNVYKLLLGWTEGVLTPFKKWSKDESTEISEELISIQLPTEIHRRFRSLDVLHFWKASELASFLHYGGIVVLQDRIGLLAYEHFKLLYCALTLLSSSFFKDHWHYAGTLLRKFVEDYSVVYDRIHLVSNVHLLIHVYDEVCRFGPLNTFSTYPFEDKLQHIKHSYVRSGYRSLHQAIGKISLLRDIETAGNRESIVYPILKTKKDEVILQVRQGFLLRNQFKDCWFLTNRNIIVKYVKATEAAGSVVIYGYPLVKRYQAFTTPYSSEMFFNYIGYESDISPSLRSISIENIKCKMVAIKTKRNEAKLHFTPLIHTLAE